MDQLLSPARERNVNSISRSRPNAELHIFGCILAGTSCHVGPGVSCHGVKRGRAVYVLAICAAMAMAEVLYDKPFHSHDRAGLEPVTSQPTATYPVS
jgi:hypothetical protein